MGRSGQSIRDRVVRRGRRRLRSSNNNGGCKSPVSSNEDEDCNDPDKCQDDHQGADDDGDGDDDEPYDDLISSSSTNKPLYARKGRYLCHMGRERFVAEAPPFLGDILWEHLEMMQRGTRLLYSIG